MSWSTKRRNSRPSLTNSTRPSPRCPATKKSSIILQISQIFFLRKFHFFEIFYHRPNLEILQHYFFVRFPPNSQNLSKKTKSFSSVTVVFGCDDIFLCEKLILRAFLTNSQLLNF